MATYITLTAMLQMQAAMVLLKVTCYTLIPMLSADIMASVRKTLLLRTAQVHLQVLVLENRLLELLPAFLMVATSSALLIEVWHALSRGACWCTLDVNTAGQVVSPVVA